MIRLLVFCALLSAVTAHVRLIRADNPPIDFAAEVRRLVHLSNWTAVATISTDASIKGYPFVTLLPMADSKLGAPSTGNIFFYLMEDVYTALNLAKNEKTSFMFTDEDCPSKKTDAESRDCLKAIISGKVIKLAPGNINHDRGKEAFLSRHPTAANWAPSGASAANDAHLHMLDVANVIVHFGPGQYQQVSLDDYFEEITEPPTNDDAPLY